MGIDPCDSDEVRGMCWLRQTVYVLLAGAALMAFLVALAVEVV
jgi:hypothetical protein